MTDGDYLREALALARKGQGHTRPNPPVGAVLVRDGQIIGRGWHRRAGGDHAEVAAIKSVHRGLHAASPRGSDIPVAANEVGSYTLYVTLEPCSKPGRVGACTDAIVAAGISRVVYAVADPNPVNRGRARRVLAKHGIDCRLAKLTAAERRPFEELIAPFGKRIQTGLPFVTVKIAMSLDGRICDDWGNAKWISSAAARRETGKMRERVDAIMVGAETVRRDNPSLLSHGRRNDDLVRVVITHSGKMPAASQIFTDGKNPTLVYRLPRKGSLEPVLRDLAARGFMHVLCEGGLQLAVALAEGGLVDEWITVLSPLVIGHRPLAKCIPFA